MFYFGALFSIYLTPHFKIHPTVMQTFKSRAVAKNLFSSAYIVGTTFFDKCFFIPFNSWKALFLIKVYLYPEVLFNRHIFAFFETTDLKEVNILFFISTILIPKLNVQCKHQSSKMKLSYIILIKFS